MMKRYFETLKLPAIVVYLALMISACGSAGKNMANEPEYRELVEDIRDLEFEIENDWANPSQYSRVNLIGNPNRIKFEEDTVEVFLPFFGERYAGGGYNADGAIQFKGIPKELKIKEKPEKGAVELSFEGNRNTENLDFQITIFSNGVARTSVTSSQREHISYDGKLVER
jgi:hypothetical protein